MKKFKVTVNGQAFEVEVEEIRQEIQAVRQVAAPKAAPERIAPAVSNVPHTPPAPPAPQPVRPVEAKSAGAVTAPMPGVINALRVKEGDRVKAGDVLLVLEAMKMENEIGSPQDGVVKEIKVKEGQSVNSGEVLVVVG